ncbi:hypothetical protein Syun_024560 [Stephania yunnanensis]|uniref:CID domain-containing protein n=1 Tax=Stephania yunnanensis TaxID=152371 RepID=A0AAP0NIT7_9MAGN
MNGTFNGQILVEKLARLNNSQQSIETLSHWCIFHMNKAKQVVETWDRQFHCSPREQRLSFLYLANDILQNSRRKGSEFVAEFWKVLPDALSDVIENGDDFGRNAALRLIDIWEDRKVFGSRGKTLKEELTGRNLDNSNRNEKNSVLKLKKSIGNILEKIISSFEVVYDGPVDEEALLTKCGTAIDSVEKAEKEIGSDYSSVQLNGTAFVELQGQHGILRECIEQLRVVESSRATLVSHLREALQEQEFKLDEVRNQLQVTQSQSEHAGHICQQVVNCKSGQLLAEQRLKEPGSFSMKKEPGSFSDMSLSFNPETPSSNREKEQSVPVMYAQRAPLNNSSYVEDDPRKSAAAAVAAKLAASTSSAQMLTYVLSSLASEGVIGNQLNESSADQPHEKKPKLENGPPPYIPSTQPLQPPLPPFPHPESVPHNLTTTSQQLVQHQPPPPSSPPPLLPGSTMLQPPLPPPQPPVPPPPSAPFMQTSGSMANVPYSYGLQPPQLISGYHPMPGAPMSSMPPYPSPNVYQNFQGPESGFYSQPPLPATPPISRQ